MTNTLLILPGDGIGPEVMAEVRKVVDWFDAHGLPFAVEEDLVGGAAYDAHGTPLSDATMARAQQVDAVLLGAVGGPKWDGLDFAVKPERGLLRLRKEMDLFANLRPAQCFDALADFSSLKREVVTGLDIMIVRELTSGIYFGEPRGIQDDNRGGRVGINTQRYTTDEIRRVARSAFELARRRANRVCSMEKANVMESGVLWREEVQRLHDEEYPDVELSHMYADAGAMQLVRWPKQFDVIVTDNLFSAGPPAGAISTLGCTIGFGLALVLVYLRQTPGLWALPLRLVCIAYVEVFRRIPFLVVIYLVLFFIQTVTTDASLFTIAVIALSWHTWAASAPA